MTLRSLALAVALLASTPALASDAAALWKSKCKSCHGETGKADTKQGKKEKVKDMTTAQWQTKHSDEDIVKGIADGVPKTKMKAFKEKLTPEEIQALAQHVRTLKE